ncbi:MULTISPECIES: hypothetical protein [Bradyrhizobium]|uniref:hypothetical protein n=1 Tax=Bradyrhizobium TaxID=374 RepID=UPI001BAA0A96|nr:MULTISPECIES: hypothetical protein [Bradyrhizobium]MBR0706270.1 hypothetical protein [Bradyrhizobium liaoningense]MDA9399153.1 hypothetical protein [Bradyrhizobium sp. CCBAU 45389]
MPSDRIDGHIDESSGDPIVRFGKRDIALPEVRENDRPLDLAENKSLTDALRWCEHTFNEDVLPPRAMLEKPQEFYASANMVTLGGEQERFRSELSFQSIIGQIALIIR